MNYKDTPGISWELLSSFVVLFYRSFLKRSADSNSWGLMTKSVTGSRRYYQFPPNLDSGVGETN